LKANNSAQITVQAPSYTVMICVRI